MPALAGVGPIDLIVFTLGLGMLFAGLWIWQGLGVALSVVGSILAGAGGILFQLSRATPVDEEDDR